MGKRSKRQLQLIKTKIDLSTTLVLPNIDKVFEIQTNASKVALVQVLIRNVCLLSTLVSNHVKQNHSGPRISKNSMLLL